LKKQSTDTLSHDKIPIGFKKSQDIELNEIQVPQRNLKSVEPKELLSLSDLKLD
jgi:hypothetical protein